MIDIVGSKKTKAGSHSKIVAAALELLMESGEGLSMTQVGKAAGITRTTLYRYFANRDEIIRAVFDDIRTSFEMGMHQAIEQQPQPDQRLDVVVNFMYQYYMERRVYRLMDTSPQVILKLTQQTFSQRVALYQQVLAPYFDYVEQLCGGKVDRKLVGFMLNNLFVSLNLFAEQPKPYEINVLLKKVVQGISQLNE